MTQERHGPGFVSLERFVAERLAEEPAADRRGEREVRAKRQVLAAYVRSKPFTVHRAGLAVALKALTAVWADHPDYDPTWRM